MYNLTGLENELLATTSGDSLPYEEVRTYTMILHDETGDNAVSLYGNTGQDEQDLSWEPKQEFDCRHQGLGMSPTLRDLEQTNHTFVPADRHADALRGSFDTQDQHVNSASRLRNESQRGAHVEPVPVTWISRPRSSVSSSVSSSGS